MARVAISDGSRPAGRLRAVLPRGRTLPDDAWRKRHRALLALLWLHAVAMPVFGLLQGEGVIHSLAHGVVLAAFAASATFAAQVRPDRTHPCRSPSSSRSSTR